MKKFLKTHWPLVGIGVLAAVVVFYFIQAADKYGQPPNLKEIFSGEGLQLKNIHYTQDDPERRFKWILDAKRVRISSDRKRARFTDFVLQLIQQDRPPMELKGERADYSRDSGLIELKGNLEGHSGDGYKIYTQHLLFNEKEKHLSSEDPVEIFGPFFFVKGRGLLVDLERHRLSILSEVTTVLEKESVI